MKKILILGLLVGLSGCKESSTGLDKEFLNTGFEKCKEYLSTSLKSPSSLKIDQAILSTFIASPDDVYKTYGSFLMNRDKIKQSYIDSKARFREMLVDIDYDAENSYGVSLRGNYQCKFIYMLENDSLSPKALDIYMFENKLDGEDVGLGVEIPLAKLTGSNFFLNSDIKNIIGSRDSEFNELDKKAYLEILEKHKYSEMNKEAEKLRKSWDEINISN